MINDILMLIASILMLCWAMVRHPHTGGCPSGFYLDSGIRTNGIYECGRDLVGDPARDGTFGHPDVSRQPSGRLYGQIYCTNGTQPIIVDWVTVGCQRFE